MDFFEVILLSGFISGILGALFGIGGGIILVPLITIYSEFNLIEATGISLFCIVGTSVSVSNHKIRANLVDLTLAMRVEIVTLVFGFLGGLVAFSLTSGHLQISFALMCTLMVIVYLYSLIKKKPDPPKVSKTHDQHEFGADGASIKAMLTVEQTGGSARDFSRNSELNDKTDALSTHHLSPHRPLLYLILSFAGLFSGMFGIGGGVIFVPLIHKLAKLPLKVATATSTYIMGMTTLGGVLGHIFRPGFPFKASILALVGVRIGALLGVRLSEKLPDSIIQLCFVGILLWVCFKMWVLAI